MLGQCKKVLIMTKDAFEEALMKTKGGGGNSMQLLTD